MDDRRREPSRAGTGTNFEHLPIAVFVLSLVGVAVSLWLSRTFELVPDCRVFIDGCHSISAAGREEPAVFVFRATIIPTGMVLIAVWWLAARWLTMLGALGGPGRFFIHLLGTASPVLLIAYIALIGSAGEIDHAIRQTVITTYFPATLVAKIILAVALLRARKPELPAWLPVTMLVMAAGVLAVAAASVVFSQLMDDPSRAHNLLQWNGTLAFSAWYLLLWQAWRRTGLGLAPVIKRHTGT